MPSSRDLSAASVAFRADTLSALVYFALAAEKEAGGESFDDGMEDAAAASPAIEHPSGSTGAQHHHHPATTPLAFHHLVHPNSTEDGTSGTAPAERPSLPPVQYTPGPFNPYPDPASGAVSSQTTMASYPQPYPHAPVLPGAASAQQKQEQPIASSSRQESTPSGSASIAANTHKRPSPSSVSLRAAGKASTSVAGPSSLDSEAGDPTGGSVAAGGGADDAHDDKRRKLKRAEQNRQAQRNFRERREKCVSGSALPQARSIGQPPRRVADRNAFVLQGTSPTSRPRLGHCI